MRTSVPHGTTGTISNASQDTLEKPKCATSTNITSVNKINNNVFLLPFDESFPPLPFHIDLDGINADRPEYSAFSSQDQLDLLSQLTSPECFMDCEYDLEEQQELNDTENRSDAKHAHERDQKQSEKKEDKKSTEESEGSLQKEKNAGKDLVASSG